MNKTLMKVLSLIGAIVIMIFIQAGCGSESDPGKEPPSQDTENPAEDNESDEEEQEEDQEEKPMGKVYELKSGQDYDMLIPALKPGDELVLHEGVYEAHVTIRVSGLPDKPIKIRGYGKGEARPILRYSGSTANLWQVYGDNLEISYLEFQPLSENAHGIRLGDENGGVRKNITIRDCVFRDSGGGSLDANYADVTYQDIKVLNNQFIGVRTTPVYIGQHDGKAPITGFVFEGNFIDASQITRDDVVGYGIELKLNVKGGIVRNNLIINSKGPGIMVYGAEDGSPADANIVEGNIVIGARQSGGILAGAGPSVIRNNIVLGCGGGGIYVYDYGNRGLLYDIEVSNNTAAGNDSYDMSFADMNSDTKGIKVLNNRVFSKEGVIGYRHLSEIEAFAETADNRTGSASSALEQQIQRLKTTHPDMEELKKVWPMLKEGPYELEQVIEILKTIDQ